MNNRQCWLTNLAIGLCLIVAKSVGLVFISPRGSGIGTRKWRSSAEDIKGGGVARDTAQAAF